MICYRDRWFCVLKDCKNFGDKCGKSLTDKVEEEAKKWWGSEGAPISIVEDPNCYEPKISEELNGR